MLIVMVCAREIQYPYMITKEQKKAAFEVVLAVSETIRVLKTVPSGELYARVMGHVDLDGYNKIIDLLKNTGLVTESAHLLEWVGPATGTGPEA